MKKKAIILSSGGLDSTFNAFKAKQAYDDVILLFIDYGQKAMSQEFIHVKKLSQLLKFRFMRIAVPFFKDLNSSLTDIKVAVSSYDKLERINSKDLPKEWVPNRNAVFAMVAGAVAESMGIEDIFMGINKEEAERYPDNTETFLERANSLLAISTIKNVNLQSYCVNMNKKEIYSQLLSIAKEMNITENELLGLIWSCYYSNIKMCGVCESCLRLKNVITNDSLFVQ